MLGIMKEIIVDRKMLGKCYNNNIIPIAACNPYVLLENKDDNKANKYTSAGLSLDKDKIFKDYKLIYQVKELPESMI